MCHIYEPHATNFTYTYIICIYIYLYTKIANNIRTNSLPFLIIPNMSLYYNCNKANFLTALITIVLHKHATILKQETQ